MYFRKVSSVSYFEQRTVIFSFVKMAGERKIQNDIADLYLETAFIIVKRLNNLKNST